MNKNESINNISLERLVTLANIAEESCVFYNNKCLIASSVDEEVVKNMFKYPTRIDAYAVLICLKGYISFQCDLDEYTLNDNMLFISTPNKIVQLKDLQLERFIVITFKQQFWEELNIDIKNIAPFYQKVQQYPCIKLSAQESNSFFSLLNMAITTAKKNSSNLYYHSLVKSFIQSCAYQVLYLIAEQMNRMELPATELNRGEIHFRNFMQLLPKYYKQERSVTFYASKLYISPKYLSTVIKEISGRSAAQWIDEYVILEAKSLLKYSTLNVQEIADELNFCNQSFFGKYFKQHTGMSPNTYRLKE